MRKNGNLSFSRENMTSPNMMNPNTMSPNTMSPNMMSPNTMNPNTMNPNTMNPNMMDPNMMNPNMMDPNMMNPNMMNPNMMNANMMNPNMMSPNMMDPNMMNPNMMSPNMMYPNMMDSNMDNMMNMKHNDNPDLSAAIALMKQAVEGEKEDRIFYDYLIKNTPSASDKEIIKGIRDNEIDHAKMFRQMYFELTGKTIPPDTTDNFEPPKTYCDGLKNALIGETNAVKKYRKILFAMMDRRHINMLTEIITDELRHGILYSFLIHSNDCKY
ncbi:MAG TPA: ferritin-like domain-containing protein [Ruminiclostridium sp.]